MATRIPKTTKQLAHQKLREGMTAKEVAEMTGVSLRTVERMMAQLGGKSAMPARHAAKPPPPADSPPPPPADRQESTTPLEFQDSPAPVEKKSLLDQSWASLKGMLGIEKQEGTKEPAPLSGPLDARRQAFVTNITPTASLAVMLVAAHMWSKLGPEYRVLAPKEDVARRIAEPLVRIYARHASFGIEVNPDIADLGASMFALVGYIYTSLELYQVIKEKKEAEEEAHAEGSPNGHREYRAAQPGGQNGASSQGGGFAAVPRTDYEDDRANGGHVGHAGAVGGTHLTAKEQAQFEALSALREQDYRVRLRRSGRAA